MGKSKEFLKKPLKPQKHKPARPETADEFQEAADLEEETGGKWRAGDQAKSCRAFLRAIQIYNEGLQKHPKNFDLAYNKARLEFDLSQQPALVAKLPMTFVELLQQALASHRFALRLDEENADILFNTAQVMISIAEYVTETSSFPAQGDAVSLLHEALELLSACFSRQEMLREEQGMDFTNDAAGDGVPLDSKDREEQLDPANQSSSIADDDSSEAEEQYATIQEPVTATDLLDTARASLTALTLLISLEDSTAIPTLAQMAHSITDMKIPNYLNELSPEERAEASTEIALERAEFIATLANAEYKTGSLTLEDVLSRLSVFEELSDMAVNVAAMCTYADALVEFASTSSLFFQHSAPNPSAADDAMKAKLASICWTQLTKAQDLYARAVKVDDDETKARKAQIYESRGDVELLRFKLAATPSSSSLPASVVASAPTLLKNAQVYYKGATTLFRNKGDVDAAAQVEVRGLVAAVLAGKMSGQPAAAAEALRAKGEEAVGAVATVMLREGILDEEWDQGL